MATPKSNLKAIDKFNKEKTNVVSVRLNKNTDADIIEKLNSVPSKMGYIKDLIRKDIEKWLSISFDNTI